MSALDPCPDDLMVRATNAPLAPAERSLVAAHLARCSSCRTAAEVAGALADEPSTLPGDELLIARMTDRAVARTVPGRRARRPVRAAAAVLVAASAMAGLWHFARGPRSTSSRPAASEAGAPATARGLTAAPAPAPAAPPSVTPNSPTEAPLANDERAEGNHHAPRRLAARSVDLDRLLGEARAARVRGDSARARLLYARVARLAPGTPAAAVAEIAIGLLLLERGENSDARAALEAFDRYLAAAPTGALREEATAGRARALERLGERARAIAAWQELLDSHPRSLQAPLARQRLEALGGAPENTTGP